MLNAIKDISDELDPTSGIQKKQIYMWPIKIQKNIRMDNMECESQCNETD